MPIQGEMGVFQALELQRQTQKETEKGTTLSVDCTPYMHIRYIYSRVHKNSTVQGLK